MVEGLRIMVTVRVLECRFLGECTKHIRGTPGEDLAIRRCGNSESDGIEVRIVGSIFTSVPLLKISPSPFTEGYIVGVRCSPIIDPPAHRSCSEPF